MPAKKKAPPLTAAEMGRKGGAARAKSLAADERKRIASAGAKATNAKRTPAQRKASASKAAQSRWKKLTKKN